MKNNINIAFDLDGVIWDFAKIIKKRYIELSLPYDDSKYYNNPMNHNPSEMIKYLINNRSDELELYQFVREYILKFYELFNCGFLVFVTSRNINMKSITKKSFMNFFPEFNDVIFSFCKEGNKNDFLNGFEYFVDDRPENLIPCVDKYKKRLYLIDRPWNSPKIYGNLPSIIKRVCSLKDVYEDYCNLERINEV